MSSNPFDAPIAFVDEDLTVKVSRDRLRQRFEDGTPITSTSIVRAVKGWFIELRGKDEQGNCHARRAPVTFDPQGAVRIDYTLDAAGEDCVGDPCSHCEFPDAGGCRCLDHDIGHRCNHSTHHVEPEFVFDRIF